MEEPGGGISGRPYSGLDEPDEPSGEEAAEKSGEEAAEKPGEEAAEKPGDGAGERRRRRGLRRLAHLVGPLRQPVA